MVSPGGTVPGDADDGSRLGHTAPIVNGVVNCLDVGRRLSAGSRADASRPASISDGVSVGQVPDLLTGAAMAVAGGEGKDVDRDAHEVIDEAKAAGLHVSPRGVHVDVPPAIVAADALREPLGRLRYDPVCIPWLSGGTAGERSPDPPGLRTSLPGTP